MSNLFEGIPIALPDELVETLAVGTRFRLERIVSRGHATPPGEWYDQAAAEWVVLLSGAARLRFADENEARPLRPGDWLLISARRRHRVDWTDTERDTVWLAVHYD
jgi:cupin 2 domain-containing protein